MKNFFPSYRMNPNLECTSSWCQRRREEYEKKRASEPVVVSEEAPAEDPVVVHEDNLYGMQDKFSQSFCLFRKPNKITARALIY
jgi:hypothetical protein